MACGFARELGRLARAAGIVLEFEDSSVEHPEVHEKVVPLTGAPFTALEVNDFAVPPDPLVEGLGTPSITFGFQKRLDFDREEFHGSISGSLGRWFSHSSPREGLK